MNVLKQMSDILNYYKENPGCDPNMSQYVGLCYDMAKYLQKETPLYGIHHRIGEDNKEITKEEARKLYPVPTATYDFFKELSKQFETKLLGNDLGITEESPLFKLYWEAYVGVSSYKSFEDTPLLQKLGGVALNIAQQERAVKKGEIEEFTYDNEAEMKEIIKLNEEFPVNNETEFPARELLLEEIKNKYQKGTKTK